MEARRNLIVLGVEEIKNRANYADLKWAGKKSTLFSMGAQRNPSRVMNMAVSASRVGLLHSVTNVPIEIPSIYLYNTQQISRAAFVTVCRSASELTRLHKTKHQDNQVAVERFACTQCWMSCGSYESFKMTSTTWKSFLKCLFGSYES